MGFISELLLLIATATLAPSLLLVSSTPGPIDINWFSIYLLTSLLISLVGIYRIRRRFIDPMRQLIERLYGRSDSATPLDNGDVRRLEQAANFFAAQRNRRESEQITALSQLLREQAAQHQSEKDQLLKESRKLAAGIGELTDRQEHLRVLRTLLKAALGHLTIAHNRRPGDGTVGPELSRAAGAIEFLLREPGRASDIDTHNVLELIDETLTILAPLLRERRCRLDVSFDKGCPTRAQLDAEGFKEALFGVLLAHLKTTRGNGRPEDAITMKVGRSSARLRLTFSTAFAPKITHTLGEILKGRHATWHNNSLFFPAVATMANPIPPDSGLTALIITEDENELASLTQRLGFLGVNCTTDCRSARIDLCLVADERSDAFARAKQYLGAAVCVLLLNNRVHYRQPGWFQADDPVTQSVLLAVIDPVRKAGKGQPAAAREVLAVDDSEANLRLLEMRLAELGCVVRLAKSGHEAIECVNEGTFDMIFMDIQMPGLDGVEATRRIREAGHRLPIVGLTAHVTAGEREACGAAGMNDVLVKPAKAEDLQATIRRVCKPPALAADAGQAPVFDMDLALANANNRPELAGELLLLLITGLPEDQKAINDAVDDPAALRRAVHKLHGAVSYCGVPRLSNAIEKLETALKERDEGQVPLLLNLLNGEITTLISRYREDPELLTESPG